MVIEYKLLEGETAEILEFKVIRYLFEEWELQGGVSVSSVSYESQRDGGTSFISSYTQAVIKKHNKPA